MQKIILNVLQKLSDNCPQTPFGVEFWDGTAKKLGQGSEKFRIVFKSESAIKHILSSGSLGFGQEYMVGNIVVEGNLQALVALYDQWQKVARGLSLATKARILWNRVSSRGTIVGSKKNIRRHYDIGNDFYSLWLDPTMTYSCAYFKSENDGLETAQNNKYEHICRKLQLKAGESLVDIGCGWGGMMFYAAKNYGVKCVGYTLSKNQYDYVNEKIKKENWSDSIKICLDDYRKAIGVFDKFVSIGMFEHVGKRYQKNFFETVKKILKPKGIGLLHTIGSLADSPADPWFTKYIFPGGYIPPLAMVVDNMNKASLAFYDVEDLRPHYARTLDFWIKNFENNTAAVKKTLTAKLRDQNQADQFIRMWRLYLNASSMSFKTGANRLYQILFSNGINDNLPLTLDYIYRD